MSFLCSNFYINKSILSDFMNRTLSSHIPRVCFKYCQRLECHPCRWNRKLNAYWTWYSERFGLFLCLFDKRCSCLQLRIFRCLNQELRGLQVLLFCTLSMAIRSLIWHKNTWMFHVRIVESYEPVTKVFLFIKNKLVTLLVWPIKLWAIPL